VRFESSVVGTTTACCTTGMARGWSVVRVLASLFLLDCILWSFGEEDDHDHDHDDDKLPERTGSNDKSVKFLEANAQRPGVVGLPSGLQYKVIKAGNGGYHPGKDGTAHCHYVATSTRLMPDFFERSDKDASTWVAFDRTRESPKSEPAQLAIGQIAWGTVLQMMVEGDTWDVFVPSELIKKTSEEEEMPGDDDPDAKVLKQSGDVLIFRVDLVKISGQGIPVSSCDVGSMVGCSEKQRAYIERQQKKTSDKRRSEAVRLESMTGVGMQAEDKAWLLTRIKLVKDMVQKDEL